MAGDGMSRSRATVMAGVAGLLGAAALPAQDSCDSGVVCRGFEFEAAYTGEFHEGVHGGLKTGAALSHMGVLAGSWQGASLWNVARFDAGASVMVMAGDSVSAELVGDLQGLNNIEAATGARLYEVWTETRFGAAGSTSLRAGLMDLNGEFDTPETSSLFVGPPHGIGSEFAMSGSNGPAIWPATGLGLRLQGSMARDLEWRVAAYEGQPGKPDDDSFANLRLSRDEGALLVGEMSWKPERVNKLQLGAWRYSAAFPLLDPARAAERRRGNQGAYALIDAPVMQLGASRLDAALRVGTADKDFNPVSHYAGAAITLSNPWLRNSEDAIGVARGLGPARARPGGS